MNTEQRYEVLWPLGRATTASIAPTPQFSQPDGKRIGFIWDYMFRGDAIFETISTELRKQYPRAEFVPHTVFGNVHGHDERQVIAALPERLRSEGVDAVIVGVGA